MESQVDIEDATDQNAEGISVVSASLGPEDDNTIEKIAEENAVVLNLPAYEPIKTSDIETRPTAAQSDTIPVRTFQVAQPTGKKAAPRKLLESFHRDKRGFMKRYGVRMGTIAVATTLCIAGFVVFAISLTGGPRMDHCKRMLRDFSENRGRQSKNFDPVEVSDCLAAECKFDHHQCQNQCPFGYVTDDARSCATSCECALQGRFQGDISFKPKQIDNMLMEFGHKDSEEFSVRLAHYDKLWRNVEVNGRYKIPYLLDQTLDVQQYHAVDDMIKNISQRTCIDMIPRTSEEDFVYITKAGTVCRYDFSCISAYFTSPVRFGTRIRGL